MTISHGEDDQKPLSEEVEEIDTTTVPSDMQENSSSAEETCSDTEDADLSPEEAPPTPRRRISPYDERRCPSCGRQLESRSACPYCGYNGYIPMTPRETRRIKLILLPIAAVILIILYFVFLR